MEAIVKNELFEKITEAVRTSPLDVFVEKYKDILDKHDVENIISNTSEKISAIKDPFERVVFAFSFVDKVMDLETEELIKIRTTHEDLFRLIMMLNEMLIANRSDHKKADCLKKANEYFDKYITNFNLLNLV